MKNNYINMIQLGLFCLVLCLGSCYVASTSNSKYEYQREADVWLCLYDVPTTWANAGIRCTLEGVPLASTPLGWAPGEPDNAGGAEDCLALTGAGTLEDVSCEDELPYFCRRENKHICGGRDNGDRLETAGFNKWSPGEPNNLRDNENCGSIDRDGLLNDVACASRTYAFICERSPSQSE